MAPTPALTGCAPTLENEAERLALLRSLELLDTAAEPGFDAITRLAARITGRPIALIGLVDAQRTWFKSRVGLQVPQAPREFSFCSFAIAEKDVFEVQDTSADPRFQTNPLVVGAPHVRYYAGMPLLVGGLAMGTICVVDHQPHALDEAQRAGLRDLGRLTTELLEHRVASRAKTEFIGHMNHELRTPLNAILGFGQLLELELPKGGRAGQQAEHIVEAGRHLLSLIDGSLDMMRLEAGGNRLELADVDLVPLLAAVGRLMAPIARARRIAFDLDLPETLCAQADATRAKQVLLNLASNAVKYSREGGRVALRAGGGGEKGCANEAWIEVADSGPGLTSEQIGKLFKPFERLGQERGGVPGTGLGLALSSRLSKAMGGRIGVRSAPGHGSVFTLHLQGC